jgi:hypothetical protein
VSGGDPSERRVRARSTGMCDARVATDTLSKALVALFTTPPTIWVIYVVNSATMAPIFYIKKTPIQLRRFDFFLFFNNLHMLIFTKL